MINLEIFRQTLKKFCNNRQAPNQAKKVEVVTPKKYFERKVDTALVEFLRASVKASTDESVKQIICGLGIFQATKKATLEGAAMVEVTASNVKYIAALEEYGGLKFEEISGGVESRLAIPAESLNEVTARIMEEYLLPPNCYDSDGVITAATGKRYRYVDIRQQTSAPIEIKTAAIGDCKKCTYAKAQGTAYDTCAKCQELGTYFEWAKANLHTIPGSMAIYRLGLSPYEEILKIGYDPATMEIILPLDSRKYVSIALNYGDDRSNYGFVNLDSARRVLSHYNLQPRRNGETTLDGRCNYDTPYLDNRFVGTDGEIIFAGCIGLVYQRIKLPFPPTEEIQIRQPYKI